MKRYLIVNADDCGFDIPTTDGVFDAHLNGIVSSTSVVVNFDGFTYAATRLIETPTLRAGVHLNLYQGKPVMVGPSNWNAAFKKITPLLGDRTRTSFTAFLREFE